MFGPLIRFTASTMTYTVSGGALNSTQSNPLIGWVNGSRDWLLCRLLWLRRVCAVGLLLAAVRMLITRLETASQLWRFTMSLVTSLIQRMPRITHSWSSINALRRLVITLVASQTPVHSQFIGHTQGHNHRNGWSEVSGNLVKSGYLYSAQCRWRNGENNRTLTITLSLTLSLTLILTLTLFLTLNLTVNDYFRHCAICIAPNTDSRKISATRCQILWLKCTKFTFR